MSGADFGALIALYLVAIQSPGPATLAIAATAMAEGRATALALLVASAPAFLVLKIVGAGYLAYLAIKAVRSALRAGEHLPREPIRADLRGAYLKGCLIHFTNPKAVLFWGALFTVFVGPGASAADLIKVVLVCSVLGAICFPGFAIVFSIPGAQRGYFRLRRWIDGALAAVFSFAAFKVLTARLS
ncbi:MAG: LysE family translocator [Pseudomonadota bacterium]